MQPSRLFFDASILNNHFAIVYLAIFSLFPITLFIVIHF